MQKVQTIITLGNLCCRIHIIVCREIRGRHGEPGVHQVTLFSGRRIIKLSILLNNRKPKQNE